MWRGPVSLLEIWVANDASILAAAAGNAAAANVAAVQAAGIARGGGPGTWMVVGCDGSIFLNLEL